MLIDDLKELLKSIEPDVELIKKFWKNSGIDEEYQKLYERVHQPDFWKDKDQANISKRSEQVKDQRNSYNTIINTYKEFNELLDLFGEDEVELKKLNKKLLHPFAI